MALRKWFIWFWLVPLAARAADADRDAGVSSQGAYLAQVLVGLLVVLGLIFAMSWVLRRLGQGNLVGSQHLKILASLSLGTREKIALVQVGEQQLLLGITPNAINTLQTFDRPVITAPTEAPGSEFASRLKALMKRPEKVKSPVDKR